eukprot:7382535-Prymnesium_polylepis.1
MPYIFIFPQYLAVQTIPHIIPILSGPVPAPIHPLPARARRACPSADPLFPRVASARAGPCAACRARSGARCVTRPSASAR